MAVSTTSLPPGSLNKTERAEYERLNALLNENEMRRVKIALVKASLSSPARVAAVEARERDLFATSFALSNLRQRLHGRHKWPELY